jgi:hypothetical protein
MTEAEWVACTEPEPMLEFLRGKSSDRKLRLFACACCRHVWDRLQSGYSHDAVEATEQIVDGLAQGDDIRALYRIRGEIIWAEGGRWANSIAFSLATPLKDSWERGREVAWETAALGGRKKERHHQAILVLDIFGNPFCPVSLDPAWLTWKDGTIPKMAQVIYQDRHMPAGQLDPDRMAILGDALEDAGCSDPDILGHCRGPGPHVRGCWLIDLILGKG